MGKMRSNLFTVVAIALLAFALDDMVHEVLGHGTACIVLGVKMLGLSTIGLQTASSSRIVASAGSIANVLAGVLGAVILTRGRGFNPTRYFIWLFSFVNLMNGTGYLMASAATGSGDWAAVIAGVEPAIAWRLGMGVAGIATYAASVIWAGRVVRSWTAAGELSASDVPRLTAVPYVTGGLLFVLASAFNPVGPSMILASGVAASFGLTFGLLIVMRDAASAPTRTPAPQSLPLHGGWVILGVGAAAVFVGVLGPGVRL